MNTWNEIRKLTKDELLNLLVAYDKYVIDITDREDGSIPVCVAEFYDNEYQFLIKNLCYNCHKDTGEEYFICQVCDNIFCEECFDEETDSCGLC